MTSIELSSCGFVAANNLTRSPSLLKSLPPPGTASQVSTASAGATKMPAYHDLLATSLFDLVRTYIRNAHASVGPVHGIRSIIGTHYPIVATVVLFQAWIWAITPSNNMMHKDLMHAAGWSITLMLASCDLWALNVALIAFVAHWTRLPNMPSFSPSMDDLPSFDRFVTNLCEASIPTPTKAITANETSEEMEHPSCIVFWSSDDDKQVPCAHFVCVDCLRNLRANCQYACPLCRIALFKRPDIKILLAYKATLSQGRDRLVACTAACSALW